MRKVEAAHPLEALGKKLAGRIELAPH